VTLMVTVMVLRRRGRRVQAHGIPVAPMTGQRPGLAEPFAAHRTPERFLLDVYVPVRNGKPRGSRIYYRAVKRTADRRQPTACVTAHVAAARQQS